MKNLKFLMGSIALAALIGFGMAGCGNGTIDGGGDPPKTPEEKTAAERWSTWINPEIGATISIIVGSDDVCAITIGGTPYSTLYEGDARYEYSAVADKSYTYTFEAWTESGERDVSFQYFRGQEFELPSKSMTIQINATRTTYKVVGEPIPVGGVRLLQFRSMNKLGTFYVKILSIEETVSTDPKTLVINGITPELMALGSAGGFVGLFPVGTPKENVIADIMSYLNGSMRYNYATAGMDFDQIDDPVLVDSTYTVTVPLYVPDGTAPWTGLGSYDVWNAFSDGSNGYLYKVSNVPFISAVTTIDALDYIPILSEPLGTFRVRVTDIPKAVMDLGLSSAMKLDIPLYIANSFEALDPDAPPYNLAGRTPGYNNAESYDDTDYPGGGPLFYYEFYFWNNTGGTQYRGIAGNYDIALVKYNESGVARPSWEGGVTMPGIDKVDEVIVIKNVWLDINTLNTFSYNAGVKVFPFDDPVISAAKTLLQNKINEANAAKSGVVAANNAGEVNIGMYWTEQVNFDTFNDAIAAAQAVLNNAGATKNMLDNARNTLQTAIESFESKLKEGSKSTVSFTVNNGGEWDAAIGDIRSGGSSNYAINIGADFDLAGSTAVTFGSRTGITVTITGDYAISLDSATQGRLLDVGANQTVVIVDLHFKGHTGNNATLVNVNGSNSSLTMRGSAKVSGNTRSGGSGGGVNASSGGSFTMEDQAEVYDNIANSGAGVNIWNGSFILGGNAKIYNNKAVVSTNSGGGVLVSRDASTASSFTMKDDAEVYGNEAGYGGGVTITGTGGSSFIMQGGVVRNNIARGDTSSSGGGVYINTSGKFTMSGNAEISYNEANSKYSRGGGIYVNNNSQFTMNGGTVSHNKSTVPSSITQISDSDTAGGGVAVNNGGSFIMNNGTVSYNTSNESGADSVGRGGGVSIEDAFSSFSMNSGKVSFNTSGSAANNRVGDGGGVAVFKGGSFTMSGDAEVSDNKAISMYVSVGSYSVVAMGGGVLLYEGSFIMEDESKVLRNEATGSGTSYGGGVSISEGSFTMRGNAEVSSNIASGNRGASGGGVYAQDIFIMQDNAKVSGNTATGSNTLDPANGGGVYVSGSLTMYDNAEISGNKATNSDSRGGGVCVYGSLQIYSGVVYGSNEATATLRNSVVSATNAGASLFMLNWGTIKAEYWNGSIWVSIPTTAASGTNGFYRNETIKVVEGVLQ